MPRGGKHHHGDLKRALLDAAEEALRTQSPEQLSLRKLSAALGVSVTAPYAHFPTKEDLLAALAERGFTELHARMTRARKRKAANEETALAHLAVAYLRFAAEHPGQYRVMFRDGLPFGYSESLDTIAAAGFDVLRQTVAALPRHDDQTASHNEIALLAWTLVHGFAMLRSDARIAPTIGADPEIRRFAHLAAHHVAKGLLTV